MAVMSSNTMNAIAKNIVKNKHMEVVEWSARLARKREIRVRRLLAPSSMMHIIL